MASSTTVCALYCFCPIEDPFELRVNLKNICDENLIKGGLIIATEGINGTVAGPSEGMENLITFIQSDHRFANVDVKKSYSQDQPFYRMRIQVKNEIVTLGCLDVDPNLQRGVYVEPKDWNKVLLDPNVLIIDTRNDYEVAIGTFRYSRNPQTKIFREFPTYIDKELQRTNSDRRRSNEGDSISSIISDQDAPRLTKDSKVAMYCTGGIRCEKASAYLRKIGFSEVYHLKGGILKYLEDIPKEDSLWEGECYVFDQRVSVTHGVQQGSYTLCRSCRLPLSANDTSPSNPLYQEGVHCHNCYHSLTPKQKEAAAERQKQIELSELRQTPHLGYKGPSSHSHKRDKLITKRGQGDVEQSHDTFHEEYSSFGHSSRSQTTSCEAEAIMTCAELFQEEEDN
jgi:UPF0176 protein